jgi:polyisoprenoid-binding protein YceI
MKNRQLLASVLLLPVLACDNSPAAGKAGATVADAVRQSSVAATATGERCTFSNQGSSVEFVGAKVTGKHSGSFGIFKGTIVLTDNEPTRSAVDVEIDVGSLQADDPKLTSHLKSPDLLDATKYKTARFVSTSVARSPEGGSHYTVSGNLELHGVTKSIGFPASIEVSAGHVYVNAEFVINRKDFAIAYPGMPDDLIKDEVLLKLKLHAPRGEQAAAALVP